jgi:chromosome segregation ATPase
MGVSVPNDPNLNTELLQAVTDPAIFGQRLQTINERMTYADKTLAQAKDENLKMEAAKAEAQTIQAGVLELISKQTAQDKDLREREAALEKRYQSIISDEKEIAEKKQDTEAKLAAVADDISKRLKAVQQAEADGVAKREKLEADLKSAAEQAEGKRAADYQAKVDAVVKSEQQLAAKHAQLDQNLADTDALKKSYESKLAAFQNIVATNS